MFNSYHFDVQTYKNKMMRTTRKKEVNIHAVYGIKSLCIYIVFCRFHYDFRDKNIKTKTGKLFKVSKLSSKAN